jgi:hypothetical protein
VYVNTITITLTIAPEFNSVKTYMSTRSLLPRVIVIMLIYTQFNLAELGCYCQSYRGRVDIQVLTELNSGVIVRVIVVVLIYRF